VENNDGGSGAGLVKCTCMKSSLVAFRGTKQVLTAYELNDMAPWAIWNGKALMFADEKGDTASLKEVLETMHRGGSRGAFTLCVYKLKGNEEILSTTPFSRSFNFCLYDDDDLSSYDMGRNSYRSVADDKIAELQTQIDLLKSQLSGEHEDREKPEGMSGVIAGFLGDPMMKQILMQAVSGIVQKIVPMSRAVPAQVAGVEPGEGQVLKSVLQPDQVEKAQRAINILSSKDPLLGDHLLKLANLALTNEGQFKFLIGMLQNM
jgi:hypothetical protein